MMTARRQEHLRIWPWLVVVTALLIGIVALLMNSREPAEASKGIQSVGVKPSARSVASFQRTSPDAAVVNGEQNKNSSTNRSALRITPPAAAAVVHPGDDTPVKEVFARLEAAALSGDARAACRIGMEKMRCLLLRQPNGANAKDKALCEGISAEQTQDAWKFLYLAAEAGSVPAMSLFVRSPGLSWSSPLESADGWVTYRDNAPRLQARAVEGGDVMALFSAWWNSATALSAGGEGVFKKDPYSALVYGNAALPLLDPRRRAMVQRLNSQLQTQISPNLIAQAVVEGKTLRERYFSGATPPRDTFDDAYLSPMDCAK
jgi:hypothetical protein